MTATEYVNDSELPNPDGLQSLVRLGWSRAVDHGKVQSLHYPDGTIRVRHECHAARWPDNLRLVVAPALTVPGHIVVSVDPVTIAPSILCEDCGLHGYIENNAWRDC